MDNPKKVSTGSEQLIAGGMPRNPSRFQVNRVNAEEGDGIVAEDQALMDGVEAIELTDNVNGPPSAAYSIGKQVQFIVGPSGKEPYPDGRHSTGHNATDDHHNMSTIGYGTANLKSFRNVQTIDRVPHQDHYRNVMSIEGAMAVRPTLEQLHLPKANGKQRSELTDLKHFYGHSFQSFDGVQVKSVSTPRSKFGWIKGVLMRCILSILGTMLYLRVSWMTGKVGILYAGLIILLSTCVTVLTTLSMCAICTNGEVKGGGAYFMISRSLGPEFGGSIGLIFSFANAVAAGMCVVGFAEPLVALLRNSGLSFFDEPLMEIRVIGFVTVVVLLCIVLVGVSFESKAQLILLIALTLSIIDYLIGTFIPPNRDQIGKGMTGYASQTFLGNLLPPVGFNVHTFFDVFAVFFPACTGIMAGANISGDLADPSRAIPKGTLLSIVLTSIMYFGAVVLLGSTMVREATGIPVESFAIDELGNNITSFSINETCYGGQPCYGLLHSYQIWELEGAWLPLILAGIFAATLSSALGALVSAPKVFQAVCRDRLFPKIEYFAKGFGKDDEPKRGYILFFCVAVLIIAIGSLDQIALIISDCFLVCYALVNYACFDASFAGSPGFRPGFRYYNKWVALFAAVLCIVVMFIIQWWSALFSMGLVVALYVYILHRKPDVNWGSSSQAYSYKTALHSALKLASTQEHVKNYRPQILVLTGNPVARQSLVDFVSSITKDSSLMICGHVVLQEPSHKVLNQVEKLTRQIYHGLDKRRVKSFYSAVVTPTLREGTQFLLQAAGVGKMKPNVLILGMKRSWRQSSPEEILEYFNILHDAFDNNCGLGILCVGCGLDFSESMCEHQVGDTQNLKLPEPSNPAAQLTTDGSTVNVADSQRLSLIGSGAAIDSIVTQRVGVYSESQSLLPHQNAEKINIANADGTPRYTSLSSFAAKFTTDEEDKDKLAAVDTESLLLDGCQGLQDASDPDQETSMPFDQTKSPGSSGDGSISEKRRKNLSKKQQEVLASINKFQTRLKRAFIDVWWLFDDGGLGLLIPHLLTLNRSYLEGAKLRVFTIASSRSQLQREQRSMAALLSRFRIDYSDVYVIPDLAKKPCQSTIEEFEHLLEPFRIPQTADSPGMENDHTTKLSTTSSPFTVPSSEVYVTDAEYKALKGKTYRQLRTRELLLQHSADASLIVLTLPIPRKGAISASLYLAWLEFLTTGLPSTLLLRGNQQSVLTFYS